MPNTLAHVGIQGITTQAFLRKADPKWIYLGCVIPDIPWILQRIVKFAVPGVDLYELQFYMDVQATLLFCLLLSAVFALLSRQFWNSFLILGMNSFFHLFLDACQTKWANGVSFLAPFSWGLTNFGFFWPESLPTYILTALGIAYVLRNWQRSIRLSPGVARHSSREIVLLTALVLLYLIVPVFLIHGPEEADNHYLKTIRLPENRPGQYVEFDRGRYISNPSGAFLQSSTSETFRVQGLKRSRPATVSLRGVFVNENEILVSESHVHSNWFRDTASYLGLALITLMWILAFAKHGWT
jgi:hypothetical protein